MKPPPQLEEALRSLNQWLADPAWVEAAPWLRVGFLIGMFLLLARLVVLRDDPPRKKTKKPHPVQGLLTILSLIGSCCMLGLMLRQAQWQLTGRMQPEFVAFMQRFDRREFNPAHQIRAGKILDRNGEVLAISRVLPRGIQRVYPLGPVFCHVIGYNHPIYGLTGLEAASRSYLLGGGFRTRADLKELGAELLNREKFAEGPALRTTLDARLQHAAYMALQGRVGAAVVLDVRNGDVLALVSQPSFDPNRLRPGLFAASASDAPLLNRALAGRYPPGSVFKLLIAATALEKGFTGTLHCPAEGYTTSPANPRIRDHAYYQAQEEGRSWPGYGSLDLGGALAKSSNVFFAQLGVWCGMDAIRDMAGHMRLLETVNLHEAADPTLSAGPAVLPDLSPRELYGVAQLSIGQGRVLASPLHLAQLCAGIARGGIPVLPRLDPRYPVAESGRAMSAEHAATLARLMRRVVDEGTARSLRMDGLSVAAKTGTAETGPGRASHSWLAGFAPVEEPQIAFCVLVEHGGYGSRSALPIARTLLEAALECGVLTP